MVLGLWCSPHRYDEIHPFSFTPTFHHLGLFFVGSSGEMRPPKKTRTTSCCHCSIEGCGNSLDPYDGQNRCFACLSEVPHKESMCPFSGPGKGSGRVSWRGWTSQERGNSQRWQRQTPELNQRAPGSQGGLAYFDHTPTR